MKGGQTPIHIQRWAPADYHADEHVKLLESRRAYMVLHFYRQFLDHSFMAGGDLPMDAHRLAAVVKMGPRDVQTAIEACLGKLIFQDGDRLYQRRVRREVAKELRYRRKQASLGKKGGRPKKNSKDEGEFKGTVLDPKSPPAPTPTPAPSSNNNDPPTPPAGAGGSGSAGRPHGRAHGNGSALKGAVLEGAVNDLVAHWRHLARFDRTAAGGWAEEPATVPQESNVRHWSRALRRGRLTVDELRKGISNRVFTDLLRMGKVNGDEQWPPPEEV